MTRRSRLMTAFAVGAVVAAAVAAPAQAAGLGCGDTIGSPGTFVLSTDLLCAGDGLHIAASNVTLDLRGHTLAGVGGAGTGIRIDWGGEYTAVTIRNGKVTGFEAGIVADTARAIHVTQVRVATFGQGLLLANTSGSLVDRSTFSSATRDGIKVDGDGNTITQNTVSDSAFGISVSNGATGTAVTRNTVLRNRDFGIAAFDGASGTLVAQNRVVGGLRGIVVAGGATGTRLSRNTVSAAASDGVLVTVDAGAGTTLSQNTSYGNGDDGFEVDRPMTTLVKNSAYDNGGAGIRAVDGVIDGGGNEAWDNGAACIGVTCSVS